MASDSPFNKTAEKVSPSKKFEEKSVKEEKDAKEIKEAAVGREAYVEAIGMGETVETTGKVSEVLEKGHEQKIAGGVGAKAKFAVYDPAQIRANLLKNVPSEKVMKRQIEREIEKEIKYLHKKATKMLRFSGNMSYFEMSNLMKKIRELKGILMHLVKATLDILKTLWLRFVHGVM